MAQWHTLVTYQALDNISRGASFTDITHFRVCSEGGYIPTPSDTQVRGELIAEGRVSYVKHSENTNGVWYTFGIEAPGLKPGTPFGSVALTDDAGSVWVVGVSLRKTGEPGSLTVASDGVLRLDVSIQGSAKEASRPHYDTLDVQELDDAKASICLVRIGYAPEPTMALRYKEGWLFAGYEVVTDTVVRSVPVPNCVRINTKDVPLLPLGEGLLLQVLDHGVRRVKRYMVHDDIVQLELEGELGLECAGKRMLIHQPRPALGEIKLPEAYELPIASAEILGGIRIGEGLFIRDGKLHTVPLKLDPKRLRELLKLEDVAVTGSYRDLKDIPEEKPAPVAPELPIASADMAGVVRLGKGLRAVDGVAEVVGIPVDLDSVYVIQTASHFVSGAVPVGEVVYALASLQAWHITPEDIGVGFITPWKGTDLTLLLELHCGDKSNLVGKVEVFTGQRRGIVALVEKAVDLQRGDRLVFRLATDSPHNYLALPNLTIAVRSSIPAKK